METDDGLWQESVQKKYIKGVPVCLIQNKMSDSLVWSDLLKIRHIYMAGRAYKLNNGKLISFWLDVWLDDKPICQQYPILYDLTMIKDNSVWDAAQANWVIQFMIRLPPMIKNIWYELANRLNQVVLNEEKDQVVWKWTTSKMFTVKYVYNQLIKSDNGPAYSIIWSAKLPEKTRFSCGLWLKDLLLQKTR
jgi:hypothetical protein